MKKTYEKLTAVTLQEKINEKNTLRKIEVEHDSIDWSCIIQFDTEIFTKELVQECLDFYSWEYDEDECLYKEYAKKLAIQVMELSKQWNEEGIKERFDEEGYPSLDGSNGVWLLRCDHRDIGEDEFTATDVIL